MRNGRIATDLSWMCKLTDCNCGQVQAVGDTFGDYERDPFITLDGGDRQIMCAIALIENRNGQLVITKLAEYFQQQGTTSAHELMDRHFGFGMRWKTGSK